MAVESVPDPVIEEPTDVIIQVTSTGICGSDLHLCEAMGAFLDSGDILGHEAMGRVVEIGSEIRNVAVGDRVVLSFTISCGTCFMCSRGLQSRCDTTQVRSQSFAELAAQAYKDFARKSDGTVKVLLRP